MPNRLTKIVTRGGDKGETSLGDGARVSKTDSRIIAIGEIDELNAWIGVVRAHLDEGLVESRLRQVQNDLFDLGGSLAIGAATLLSEKHVVRLEEAIGLFNADLPPLKEFILPGGSPLLGWLHVARTVCRRAERSLVAMGDSLDGPHFGLQYLNRLSDLLFVAGRFEARRAGLDEVFWEPGAATD